MSSDDVATLAAAIPISGEHFEAVRRSSSEQLLAAGEVLLREGQTSDRLFIVRAGTLAVSVESGREVGRLSNGAILGEVSLLDGGPATATVTAVESSKVFVLDRAALEALYESEPRAASALTRALCTTLAARIRASSDLLGAGEAGAPSLWSALRSLLGLEVRP